MVTLQVSGDPPKMQEHFNSKPLAQRAAFAPGVGEKALLAWLIFRRWGGRRVAVLGPGDSSGWGYSLVLLGVSFPIGQEDLPWSPAL